MASSGGLRRWWGVLGLVACLVAPVAPLRALRRPRMRMSTEEQRELALLPFSANECLLVGESKRVHLYEARLLTMFEDAIGRGRGGETSPLACGEIGHVLVAPSGEGVVQIMSVCGITDWKVEEVGVSATLVAKRRGRLVDVTSQDPYLTGLVAPYEDDRSSLQALAALDASSGVGPAGEERPADGAEVAVLRALAEDVDWLLKECDDREAALEAAAQWVVDGDESLEDGMSWGHYKEGEGKGFAQRLADGLEALHPGLADLGEGERVNLMSFLGASGLDALTAQIQTLQSRSVFDRLELVKTKLHEKRKLLVAKQSLLSIGGSSDGAEPKTNRDPEGDAPGSRGAAPGDSDGRASGEGNDEDTSRGAGI